MKINNPPQTPDGRLKLIGILKKLPLFAGLQDAEFAHLSDLCNGRPVAAGEDIFQQGDPSRSMIVLLSGKVSLHLQDKGEIHRLGPGDFTGEIGMISRSPRTATAHAEVDSVVMEITNDDFNLLLGQQPRIYAIIMRHIAENLARHLLRMNNFVPEAN